MTTAPMGLRERKKLATREALHEAALRLAVELGLERLTVEAICEAADVSRRTFSNHFAGKEEALLYGDRVRLLRVVELVRARPAEESPWEALSRAADELSAETSYDPVWLERMRIVRRTMSLATHSAALYAAVERDLTVDLAARTGDGDELRARILAASFLMALRIASQHWLDHPEMSVVELRRRTMELVAEQFR
ncbi:TetR/AcrR family transcriptional regulator [Actinorhabdospora filicis]|nr:TetR family transcriptional regulator [Actinorhabdospora filicis]